jgi:hypothetical protein
VSEPRRLVIVAMGFGVWTDGRHELSARWSDVARVAAVQGGAAADAPSRLALVVTLADRREITFDRTVPGWNAFVAAAPSMLSGMPAAIAWEPAVTQGPVDATVVLFERLATPRERATSRRG